MSLAQTAEKYAMKKAKKGQQRESANPHSQDDNHADEDEVFNV